MNISTSRIFTNTAADLIIANIYKSRQPLTDDERIERWWRFAEKTLKQERKFKPMVRKLFVAQETDVMRRLDANSAWIDSLARRSKVTEDDMEPLLFRREEWAVHFQVGAKPHVEAALAAAGREFLTDIVVGIEFDVTNPRVTDYISKKIFKFSFDVNDTTLNMLRKEFRAGLDAGESIYELQKRVKHVFNMSETFRSTRIARTEIIGASNHGTFEGMKQSEVVKEKGWLATKDERTRDTHRDIDGETVPLNQSFSNGLMYPGDYRGPAREIVHCRCTLIAESFKE